MCPPFADKNKISPVIHRQTNASLLHIMARVYKSERQGFQQAVELEVCITFVFSKEFLNNLTLYKTPHC